MNKVFLGLILAVCILGMALVMLNDRLGRKSEPRNQPPVAESTRLPHPSPEESAAQARAIELARAALGDPKEKELPSWAQASLPETPPKAGPKRDVKPQALPKSEPVAQRPELKPQAAPARAPEPKPLPAAVQNTEPRPEPVAPAKPEPRPKEQPARPEPKAAEKPKPEAPAAQPAKAIGNEKAATRFVVFAREKGATVRMGCSGKVEYSSMTLENPDRVVVDIEGNWKFPPNLGIPKNPLVSAVRVGQNGDKTRIVIDLKDKPRKVLLVPFKGGDGVDVRVDK